MTNKERQSERDRGRYPDGKTQNEEGIEGRRRRDYRKTSCLLMHLSLFPENFKTRRTSQSTRSEYKSQTSQSSRNLLFTNANLIFCDLFNLFMYWGAAGRLGGEVVFTILLYKVKTLQKLSALILIIS